MSTLTLYILTGLASIVFAFVLVSFARLSGQARPEVQGAKRKVDDVEPPSAPTTPLSNLIAREISQLVPSEEVSQQVSKVVSELYNKELERKLSLQNQELNKKYERSIREKEKSEELAWGKYNKTLVDKRQTEAVIRSIAEGLVVVDPQGKVLMMNPAAEKLLGISSKDKMGKPIAENLKEEQLISLAKYSEDGKDREIELVSQEDETKKILRASSAVIENENGQTVGMVSVLSDITKQKELDQMKSTFVATVSHELRTPLVAMDKSLTLILAKSTGPLTGDQEQFLTIAQRNLKRLSLLINDLLDLSKLEAGKMQVIPQPASIEQAISESVTALASWAESKSITIEKKIQEGLPEVNIDSGRIIQVLNNLIGNAIKFTLPNGTITVEAARQAQNSCLEVSVIDTGAGIAKENLGKIFSKFYQITERAPTDISGTGIGLSISKEIVELHGGRIWVESEQGQGAKFIFTLPIS